MEEVLLWSDAGEEAALHKPTGPGRGVVGKEGGEEAAAGHEGRSLALQLNLTQQARDLHAVDLVGGREGKRGGREGEERGEEEGREGGNEERGRKGGGK